MPAQRLSTKFLVPLLLLAFCALALPARSDAAPIEVHYFAVASEPVPMPKTTVGQPTQVPVALTKTSGEDRNVTSVGIGGWPNYGYGGDSCTGVVPAGQECSVNVVFGPSAAGPAAGSIEINFSDGGTEVIPVSGEGVPVEASFQPAVADFGVVGLRGTANRDLLLVNEGEAAIYPSSSSLEGVDAARFSYDFGGCQGRGLKPGESCLVHAGFEPQDAIAYEASLVVHVGTANVTAALKGHGGRPVIEPVGTLPGFGSVTVGSSGVVRTVVLTNAGNYPAGFFLGIVAGGDAGSFQLLSENCSGHELAPGATCSAQVRFRPLAAGAKQATLAFFGDGEGGALLPIDGVGVGAVASLSSYGLGFDSIDFGRRSAPIRVSVRNRGDEPIETGQVAIVGADVDQFVISGDECSGETIPVGAECVIAVRFVPDSAGAKSAKLRVGVPGGSLTATLSGNATAVKAAKAHKQGKARQKHRKHHRHHHHGHRNR